MSHRKAKQTRKETRKLLSKALKNLLNLSRGLSLSARWALAFKIVFKRKVDV